MKKEFLEVFSNSLDFVDSLKGCKKNESAVVFGGGPSFNNVNLKSSFFKDKTIITCNFKRPDLKADYHMLHDPLSIMWWQKNNVDLKNSHVLFSDIVLNYKKRNESSFAKNNGLSALNKTHVRDQWLGDIPLEEYLKEIFYARKSISQIEKKNFYIFESPFWKSRQNNFMSKAIKESNIISEKWYGSGFLAIEFAIFLGCNKIFLSGFDGGQHHTYVNFPSNRHYRMKNRNIMFWKQHGERLLFLTKNNPGLEISLINSPNSFYKNFITEKTIQ